MKNNTKIIIIGVSILAIGIPSFFIIRKKIRENKARDGMGNQGATGTGSQGTTGTGTGSQGTTGTGTGSQGTGTQEVKEYNPSSDAKAIAGWIYGANFMVYPDDVNGIILPLSESNTRALAKAYKKKYGTSLYDNLYGEWGNYYTESIDKLRKLNLA